VAGWQISLAVTWLCFSFLTFSSQPLKADDAAEIQREIARATVEISERLKRIAALEATLSSVEPRNALDGYCPVTLVKERRWLIGSPDHRVTFEGCTFSFADADRKQEFQRSPTEYAPVVDGHDPVVLFEEGERALGNRKHGVYFDDKVVLFTSEESLLRFSADPTRYLKLIETWKSNIATVELERHDGEAATDQADRPPKFNGCLRYQRRRFRRR